MTRALLVTTADLDAFRNATTRRERWHIIAPYLFAGWAEEDITAYLSEDGDPRKRTHISLRYARTGRHNTLRMVAAAFGVDPKSIGDYYAARYAPIPAPPAVCGCCDAPLTSRSLNRTDFCGECINLGLAERDDSGAWNLSERGTYHRATLRYAPAGVCACGAHLSRYRDPDETSCAPCQARTEAWEAIAA